MKKTLFTLACAALVAPAFAGEAITEPITIALPDSVTPDSSFPWRNNMSSFSETFKTITEPGYYFGWNNGTGAGSIGNKGTNNEGKLVTSSDLTSASVTLLGRTQLAGETFVMVLKDNDLVGKVVNSLTLTGSGTLTSTETVGGDFYVVVYENGELIGSANSHLDSAKSNNDVVTTLNLDNVTFTENHRIAIAYKGGQGTGANPYTINIKSLTVTPEPATATLSLLALAALAARRKRH